MKNSHYRLLCTISFVILFFGLLGLSDNMRERTTAYIFVLVISALVLGYASAKYNRKK